MGLAAAQVVEEKLLWVVEVSHIESVVAAVVR